MGQMIGTVATVVIVVGDARIEIPADLFTAMDELGMWMDGWVGGWMRGWMGELGDGTMMM